MAVKKIQITVIAAHEVLPKSLPKEAATKNESRGRNGISKYIFLGCAPNRNAAMETLTRFELAYLH